MATESHVPVLPIGLTPRDDHGGGSEGFLNSFTPVGGLCHSRPVGSLPLLVGDGSEGNQVPGLNQKVIGWNLLTAYDFSLLCAYFATQTFLTVGTALLIPCLDEFATDLHRKRSTLAASPTVSAVVGIAASLLAGVALDAIEFCWDKRCSSWLRCRRRLGHIALAIALSLQGAAAFLMPFTPPSLAHFIGMQMFMAWCAGFVNILGTTLTMRVSIRAERRFNVSRPVREHCAMGVLTGSCISIVHTGVGAGSAIAPLAANLSAALGYKRQAAYFSLGPLSVVLVGLLLVLVPPCVEPREASMKGTRRGVGEEVVHGAGNATMPSQPFSLPLFVMLFICMFLTEGQVFGAGYYGVSALHSLGFSEDYASFMVSAGNAAFGLGRLLMSVIGTRLTPLRILTVMLPSGALFATGLCLLTVNRSVTELGLPRCLFWACYLGSAFGSSAAYSWLLALYSTSGQRATGIVNGMCIVAVCLGLVFCVNVSGQLLEQFGTSAFYLSNACITWVGVLAVGAFAVQCRRAAGLHAHAHPVGRAQATADL